MLSKISKKAVSLYVCAQVFLFYTVLTLKQKGDRCSQTELCKPGLQCRYTGGERNRTKVCMAHDAESCVLGQSVYQNEEAFFPSCSYQCVCRSGQVSCVPRCNLDIMLPGPDCPFPRKVHVPGECCEKWVCDVQAELSALGGFAMAAYRQEETLGVDPSMHCVEQTTEWSACSRSCGMGTSTRVSNQNRRCEMAKQSRLCMVRPCHDLKEQGHTHTRPATTRPAQQNNECQRMKQSPKSIHYTFRNCSSVQTFRPRFCGQCSDGRCCTPHATKTAPVRFRCSDGTALKRPVMIIQTCVCHNHCPSENAARRRSAKLGYDGLLS